VPRFLSSLGRVDTCAHCRACACVCVCAHTACVGRCCLLLVACGWQQARERSVASARFWAHHTARKACHPSSGFLTLLRAVLRPPAPPELCLLPPLPILAGRTSPLPSQVMPCCPPRFRCCFRCCFCCCCWLLQLPAAPHTHPSARRFRLQAPPGGHHPNPPAGCVTLRP